MANNTEWFVEIVEDETGAVIKEIACTSARSAERVEDGVNINLDHARFTTRIVERTATGKSES